MVEEPASRMEEGSAKGSGPDDSTSTRKCKYRTKYIDIIDNEIETFRCPRNAVDGSELCLFHDENYWKEHEEEVRDEFFRELDGSVRAGRDFLAVGYNLPSIELHEDFKRNANFYKTIFHGPFEASGINFIIVDFSGAIFNMGADFSGAKFNRADFLEATFNEDADFSGAKFNEDADFSGAEFNGYADFYRAVFKENATFLGTIFLVPYKNTLDLTYRGGLFKKTHTVENTKIKCEFNDAHEIVVTKIGGAKKETIYNRSLKVGEEFEYLFKEAGTYEIRCSAHENEKGIIIVKEPYAVVKFGAIFEKPSKVLFDRVILTRVSFLDMVNLDQIKLMNVDWEERDRIIAIEERALKKKIPGLRVTREEVLWVYRKLKDCYESDARYGDAGKVFVSEMEVQRFYSEDGKENPWYKKYLSPLAVYKFLANYGESYWRPLIISAATIAAFAVFRWLAEPTKGNYLADSTAAFFQMSGSSHWLDVIERILSVPMLGTLAIALRRKLERKFRK